MGTGLLGYASYTGSFGLMAGAGLLLTLAAWSLHRPWRWVGVLTYVVAFVASLILPDREATVQELIGALLVIGGLGFIILREQEAERELAWQRNTLVALRNGSERLADARDEQSVIRAGMGILSTLKVAPNLAFVAYRQGTPYILAAKGAYEAMLDRPIHPSHNDSRSVQADHWVAEEALDLLKKPQRRRYHVAPVYGRASNHLGVLILTRDTDVDFDPEEISVVASFARLLGAQLGHLSAVHELRDANDLTLRSLGSALEHRDDDTGGHTTRVVSLSLRLARRLGWDDEQVRALRWGAYLHDLGKLAIPDKILHKRGPLDSGERQVIQTHTTVGYDMLQDLHFLPAETLDLVRYHHERWDGTGYPSRLRGQNIPETARLFAIVDVYDALTNARPYKPAWTRDRALSEIHSQSGRQFDPRYVDAFMRLMAEQQDAVIMS
ncbi:HD-GYP domain-containing protein [Deinococcus arenicola]|uniref:HD-GYP domain-containing protein n=1 Tax=Deinococcus arenicola TaxID=2994950 RepID=A0ABU4DPA6_9DEIO|nr:HD-GYP domain-containing protein [Deinococcus sp. ZS9-10]MDV6374274.1 HD-GYP domain-containing protein [Deinococcus sp. ZS9-10]